MKQPSSSFVAPLALPLTRHVAPARGARRPIRSKAGGTSSSQDKGKGKGEETGGDGKHAQLERCLQGELKQSSERGGECECIWCSGSKKRRCSWCEGKGFRHEIVTKSWEQMAEDIAKMQDANSPHFMKEPEKIPVTCSACLGTKKLRCAYCRGSGVGSYGHAHWLLSKSWSLAIYQPCVGLSFFFCIPWQRWLGLCWLGLPPFNSF